MNRSGTSRRFSGTLRRSDEHAAARSTAMKRPIALVALAALAVLNTACAEENGDAKTADPATGAKITVARNTGTTAGVVATKGSVAAAQEVGATRTEVNVLSAPKSDAKTVGQLSANTRVDIAERRGAWMRIRAGGTAGWVRLHQVRLGSGPEKTSSEGMKMLWTAGQTGRSGATGIVATTGVRGLSAEDLKTAKPNPQQVQTLEKYRASDPQAREQARAAGLREQKVALLPKEKQP